MLQSDGGVSLEKEEHKQVAEVAQELQKYCVSQPVKSPLIFGGNALIDLLLICHSFQESVEHRYARLFLYFAGSS